ncbi:arginine--tRNA ligase [Candidatus Nitrosacidococcus tergens]|uniref:Arginine--tRNA ligase n=1 Tax=Candidatus Nitrosacidococcus tergens TaxID=553981 RepID=A0A7G1Q7P3_9GAMM|nr:arginine--tRNA ligase [Candidatus Nitrosacidococcus tergens]CAB1274115.1 Arginine--tRNA ligase [Candidatus Nitrosacidococcus tergens]
MKSIIQQSIKTALSSLNQGGINIDSKAQILIEQTRNKAHGDFASNIAMILAKEVGKAPRDFAKLIIQYLPSHPYIDKVEIAGPGFINFTMTLSAFQSIIPEILEKKELFGHSQIGQNKRIHIEFVSANPTGPLHVGHGRGAAYGDSLARLLTAVGYSVHREYYVNDAGRQMDILAISIWLRYLELWGNTLLFPNNGYRGSYVWDIANIAKDIYGKKFCFSIEEIFQPLPDLTENNHEQYLDSLIQRAKQILGNDNYRIIFTLGLRSILDNIHSDLIGFGIEYDQWFSEYSLIEKNAVEEVINRLKELNYLYQKDNAWWFCSTNFNDEKDRVVIRENGQFTYFASDIAYHLNKIDRKYDKIIDIWGADHHGYIPRIKAFFHALNFDSQQLEVKLVQFATLYRSKEKVQMSTRSGEFVTLQELYEEVGKDAARFFYIMRSADQHMDFDLELAKSKSNDNPVYYIQYAHARISSIFRQMEVRELIFDLNQGKENISLLNQPNEIDLLRHLCSYPEIIEDSATQGSPHLLAYYLLELAKKFHIYYNNSVLLVIENPKLRNARLVLIMVVKQTIKNGLTLLDVSTPESM